MNFNKFINFNSHCPCCDEPLNLYMSWYDNFNVTLFEAKLIEPNLYEFVVSFPKIRKGSMYLKDNGDDFKTWIDSDSKFPEHDLNILSKRSNIHFFFLCNKRAIKEQYGYDYEINVYESCYFRSSGFLEFRKQDDNSFKLETSDSSQNDIVNEVFTFIKTTDENEKIYTLGLDYETNETALFHYVAPHNKTHRYDPNVLEKKMPMLPSRPKFDVENRDKLLDRFDSWILLS